MEIKYYKINPTGNITLIVETPVSRESQAAVAAKLMASDKEAEQVGFIETSANPDCAFKLQMMGGEFCGNASIAVSALHMSKQCLSPSETATVTIEVSGADKPLDVSVKYIRENRFTGSVSMPLPESCFDCDLVHEGESYTLPVVRMPGICHAIVTGGMGITLAESAIAEWCRQLDTEALGLMFYNAREGLLRPLVYVDSTGSLVWESSCASGSCAVAAYESSRRGESCVLSLRQPGGTLNVKSFCTRGALFGITLTGSAEIRGKYSAVIDT